MPKCNLFFFQAKKVKFEGAWHAVKLVIVLYRAADFRQQRVGRGFFLVSRWPVRRGSRARTRC